MKTELPSIGYSTDIAPRTAREIDPSQQQDLLVIQFKKDLVTPRPPSEVEQLYQAFFQHVEAEQQRLHAKSSDGSNFDLEDVIVGDAPFITEFDRLQPPYELLRPEMVANVLTTRHYNIWILNHPSRVAALKEFIHAGYQPPVAKKIPAIDKANQNKIALDFDDLGLGVTDPNLTQVEIEESARTILSRGPYTWVANNLAAIPYILSSMPDTSNTMSIATHALCGGVGFVPFDSIWTELENQLKVADRAWEIIQNDPVINSHPDKEFLLLHYHRLIGITVKPNQDCVDKIMECIRRGFTTFRFYDARSKRTLQKNFEKTIFSLQDSEFDEVRPNITFFVGQVTGKTQAKEIEKIAKKGKVGISVVVGIGGGGICSTPKEAAIKTTNVNVGRKILKTGFNVYRQRVKIPLCFDGGIGSGLPVLLAIGGGAAFKSQALVGGCIEQPPGLWYVRTENNYLGKNVSGEAANRSKSGGGKTDFLGRPLFVEGADEFVVYNPETPTMTSNIYLLLQSLATAMIFARVDSVRGYQKMRKPPIWTATDNANARARVHHNTGLKPS